MTLRRASGPDSDSTPEERGKGPAAVSGGQLAEPLAAIYAKAQDQIITGQGPALQKSVAERPYCSRLYFREIGRAFKSAAR